MKLNQLQIDILNILSKRELVQLDIILLLESREGRGKPSLSSFYTAMKKLKRLELISGRWGSRPDLYSGSVEFYAVSETGYKVIKSLKIQFKKQEAVFCNKQL